MKNTFTLTPRELEYLLELLKADRDSANDAMNYSNPLAWDGLYEEVRMINNLIATFEGRA
jgi:hypothetical protein